MSASCKVETNNRDDDTIESEYEESLPSIIKQFKTLILDSNTTVEEANKRRTVSYYEKAREAHDNEFIPGVSSYTRLIQLRRNEMNHILRYGNLKTKSHRTIIVNCDTATQKVLSEARRMILEPLDYSHDDNTRGVWIPYLNMIPEIDMHVTIALPWWWHTMGEGNYELSKEIASRFRQTLLLEFHHPFQIEFERIVLLGGKVLAALWRCVGERKTEDGVVIYDRHGDSIDPMVRLRAEIIRCFTTPSPDGRRQPLTYKHMKEQKGLRDSADFEGSVIDRKASKSSAVSPLPKKAEIVEKTPGYGEMGTGDGFIHTTLCRLPSKCLSSDDVELGQIHRLCREASATFSGHRMVISRYRFLETTGEAGDSNPCVKPIYEEIIDAPRRHNISLEGKINEEDPGISKESRNQLLQSSLTIGPASIFPLPTNQVKVEDDDKQTLDSIFAKPQE